MLDYREFDWPWLEQRLDPKRVEHTKNVMETAAHLANQYHVDERKAVTAAFYHDCAKLKDKKARAELLRKYQYASSDEERESPQLLHAPLGALVAEHEKGIEDKEILQAISSHTTGRVGMNDVEKVVYIADAIEEGRDYPGVDELRKAADQSLDQGMLAILEHTIRYLRESDQPIGEKTLACQRWLLAMQEG